MPNITPDQQSVRFTVAPWLQATTVAAVLAAPTMAHADYRLVFLADLPEVATIPGIFAFDPFIADYNGYAASSATARGSILPSGPTWSAIVSSATVDSGNPYYSGTTIPGVNAVTNIDAACDSACQALPIYMPDGTKVAGSQAALFSAPLEGITIDQYGQTYDGYVWTGTNDDGSTATGFEMGADAGNVQAGLSNFNAYPETDGLFDFASFTANTYLPIYAISGDIAGSPEDLVLSPEPASGAALLLGGLAVTRVFRRRRQH